MGFPEISDYFRTVCNFSGSSIEYHYFCSVLDLGVLYVKTHHTVYRYDHSVYVYGHTVYLYGHTVYVYGRTVYLNADVT